MKNYLWPSLLQNLMKEVQVGDVASVVAGEQLGDSSAIKEALLAIRVKSVTMDLNSELGQP